MPSVASRTEPSGTVDAAISGMNLWAPTSSIRTVPATAWTSAVFPKTGALGGGRPGALLICAHPPALRRLASDRRRLQSPSLVLLPHQEALPVRLRPALRAESGGLADARASASGSSAETVRGLQGPTEERFERQPCCGVGQRSDPDQAAVVVVFDGRGDAYLLEPLLLS